MADGVNSSFFFFLTVRTIEERNNLQPRRWGMIVTVTSDPTTGNNKDYYLKYSATNADINDNDNWVEAAQPPDVFDGDGTAFTAKVFTLPGQDEIPNSTAIKVRCEIVARRDGVNNSYMKEMVGLFNKASDGTFTLVGAVATLAEVDGYAGTVPTAILNVTGNSIIVTFNGNLGGVNSFLAGKFEVIQITDTTL